MKKNQMTLMLCARMPVLQPQKTHCLWQNAVNELCTAAAEAAPAGARGGGEVHVADAINK